MQIIRYPERSTWPEILKRPVDDSSEMEAKIKLVLSDIQTRGDEAVRRYTQQFDGAELSDFRVSPQEIQQAAAAIDDDLKAAIETARANIESFHRSQISQEAVVETMPGVRCWRRSVPVESVGLYIPGGTSPLFSTVLMLGVPAEIAGCQTVVLCTPPDKNGNVHPAILYTANLVGITQIFKIGGAQAIAALAYGTETVPKVHKIFGPGNQYVVAAKQLVSKDGIAIDLPAGPSEVAVIADASADPDFVAADLLSQAEHGPDSQVLLATDGDGFLESVQSAVTRQLAALPRRDIAAAALANSKLVLVKSTGEALTLINAYAPEHLIIMTEKADDLAAKVTNAGSVFLGKFSPESAGDYASGTNHTLPTNGYAAAYSGVSLDSFVKKITFQQISKSGLQQIGPAVEAMAAAEGLDAHKEAVSIRLRKTGL